MIKVAMKSTKLLAVLAGAAIFTACSQEELVENNRTPQQMEEIVGAKLVGTDVSLNVTMGEAKSRWAGGEAKWEKEDLVGLGWITNGKPYEDQMKDGVPVKPTQARLYANHKYNYDEEAKTWTTQGNLYEGWYFAYYQWGYMPKVAEKTFTVNPTQKTNDQIKHYSERLFISSRKFIEAGTVNTESNTLNEEFKLLPAVKAFRVKTNPAEGSSFAKNEKMKAKKIEYITFNTGDDTKKIFATELKFAPQNLPVWDVTVEPEANVAAFYNNLYTGKNPVLSVDAANWTSILTTKFEDEGKQAAFGDNRLVAYAVPATAELDDKKVSIKIGVEGGYFLINKDDKNEKNLKALKQFVDAYCGEDKEGCGSMTKIDATDETNWAMTLDIELHDDIFFTDFTQIKNYNDWKGAVEMVEILGREQERFEIIGQIDFAEGILMPKNDCKLTVDRGNDVDVDDSKESSSATLANYFFNITGNMTGWPENLTSNTIKVQIAKGVTVDDAHLISARQIVNYGTMNVPAEKTLTVNLVGAAKIKNESEINLGYKSKVSNIDNAIGRINVIYGSYVELLSGTNAGEIAYIVDEDDAAEPQRIKDVIAVTGSGTDREYANVNILVFNKEKVAEFDFTKSTSGKPSDNPYYDNSTDGSEEVLVLNDVNLEINGVEVSSSSTETTVTVKDVTINGGAIKNIAVAGNLTVKGGNVVANVANIAEALTIKAGQGEITAATIGSVDIKSGNFTVNAETIEGNVTATGENYFNVETINGDVVLTNNSNSATSITGATITGNVTLKGDFHLAGVTIKGNLTVDGNIKANENTNIGGTLTVNSGSYTNSAAEDITIGNIVVKKGAEFTTDCDIYTETIEVYGKVTVNEGKTLWYTVPLSEGGYVQVGSTTGKISNKSNAALIEDLEAAIAVGGNVTLKADVALNESLEIANDVNIDLNGNTFTGNIIATKDLTVSNGDLKNENPKVSAIEINSGKLTLENVEVASARHAVRIDGQVEAEIKSGFYKAIGTAGSTTHALNVSGNATVVIYDGTFEGPRGTSADSGAAVNVQAGATVVIEGGNFFGGKNKTLQNKGSLIVKGGTFDQDPSDYVDLGKYDVTNNGATWTVTEK